MKSYTALLIIFQFVVLALSAQKNASLEELSQQNLLPAIQEFREFLSIPNNGLYKEHVDRNVVWCESAFANRGFETQQLATKGAPMLLATKKGKNAKQTVLFYVQVDGQPVDTSKWDQESPYLPTLKKQSDDNWQQIDWELLNGQVNDNWRIFARSTSDAKGPIIMFLKAMDIMNDHNWEPNYNIKVIMDFEEEMGSPNLPAGVEAHREALKSDMLVILDGPRHPSNQPTLSFGARGISTITLKVFGPRRPQHSGHYGNYIPNPALKLSQLLASMKDEHGRVTIPGYYDGIELNEETTAILGEIPDDEEAIKKMIGVANSDKVASTLQESIQYPSLNIRGMQSGWVEAESRTIIPSTAIAEIDVRIVKENDPDRLISLVKKHIAEKGYHFVNGEPTDEERSQFSNLISFTYKNSYGAFRTDYDSKVGLWLNKALTTAFGKAPIRKRTSGGSIPISPFVNTLGIPAVTVPTVNSDNNQHSPNENIRIGNLKDGIKTCLAILKEEL